MSDVRKGDGGNEELPLGHIRDASKPQDFAILTPKHVEDLKSSGLSAEQIAASGCFTERRSQDVAKHLGWAWRRGAALCFPFRDYFSPDVTTPLLVRCKPDNPRPRKGGGKPVKYEQAPGTPPTPFVPPQTLRQRRFDDSAVPVVWTEGEKKALLLDQLGFATVGITGVHVFHDAQAFRNGDGFRWSSAFKRIAEHVASRQHVLCFDSDVQTKPEVMLALRRLAGLLLAGGALGVSFVAVPPDPKDADAGNGIDDYHQQAGADAALALFAKTQPIAPGETIDPIPPTDPLVSVATLTFLKRAKLPSALRIPDGYSIRRDLRLWTDPPDEAMPSEVAKSVLFPIAIHQLDDGDQWVDLRYCDRGVWRTDTVDRRALRDSRRAVSELPAGCSVSSNNAAKLIDWFDAWMHSNADRMTQRQTVRQCGWHEDADGDPMFVLDRAIGEGSSDVTAFGGSDQRRLLAALGSLGDESAQRALVREAFEASSVAATLVCGALAAPLLRPLGAPNFAIHVPGESSRGKTSMLTVAASLYGNPRSAAWLASWNATSTGLETRAETLCDLPQCYDEAGAGDRQIVERSVYTLINGVGRSRATRELTQRATASWRTIVLSTGEHQIADDSASTGAQVRVIQLPVDGFGQLGAVDVDRIRDGVCDHYGLLGRTWLAALVGLDDWGPWRDLYARARAAFRQKVDGDHNTLAGRQAAFWALLSVAESMAAKVIGVGREDGSTMAAMALGRGDVAPQTPKPIGERALDLVGDWVASQPSNFPKTRPSQSGGLEAPVSGAKGQICGYLTPSAVLLIPDQLHRYLADRNMASAEAVRAWKRQGLLEVDDHRRTKRYVRVNGVRSRYAALRLSAIDGET